MFEGRIVSGLCKCINGTFIVIKDSTTAHICYNTNTVFRKFGANTRFENKSNVYFIPYDKQKKLWYVDIYRRIIDIYSGGFITLTDCPYNVSWSFSMKPVIKENNVKSVTVMQLEKSFFNIKIDNDYISVLLYPNRIIYSTIQGELIYLRIEGRKCSRDIMIKFEGVTEYTEVFDPEIPDDAGGTNNLIIGATTGCFGIILILAAVMCLIRLRRREKLHLHVPPPYPTLKVDSVVENNITLPNHHHIDQRIINEIVDSYPIYESINDDDPEYQEIHNKTNEHISRKRLEDVIKNKYIEDRYVNGQCEIKNEFKQPEVSNNFCNLYENTVNPDVIEENKLNEIKIRCENVYSTKPERDTNERCYIEENEYVNSQCEPDKEFKVLEHDGKVSFMHEKTVNQDHIEDKGQERDN